MDEEKLRQSFAKIKEDILNLTFTLADIKKEIQENNKLIRQMDDELIMLKLDVMTQNQENIQKQTPTHISTHFPENQTNPVTSTHNSTDAQEIGGWNTQNLGISIGNEGVSTDRQTDRQTVRQTHFEPKIPQLGTTKQHLNPQNIEYVVTKKQPLAQPKLSKINTQTTPKTPSKPLKPIQQQISEASEILDSLDNIKKEIRKKFKSITKQEMLVFTTLFIMEEAEDPDYNKLAIKLNLSESSIRDYIQRMINKGIPIEKEKINNKKIILHISPELKKIASLDTIIKLRDI